MMDMYVYAFAVSWPKKGEDVSNNRFPFHSYFGQELGCQNDGVKKVSTRREDSVEIIDNIICNYDGPNQTKCMFRPYYMR